MIRYKIQVETKYNIFYLKRDYYCTDDLLRAIELMDFSKFSHRIIRACAMINDCCLQRSEPLLLPEHSNVPQN
jgi:hypothetical protein